MVLTLNDLEQNIESVADSEDMAIRNLETPKVIKFSYDKINAFDEFINATCSEWSNLIGRFIDPEEITGIFLDLYKITNVGKYRSFQYRLLIHSIVLNVYLKKCNMDDNYAFCNDETETMSFIVLL